MGRSKVLFAALFLVFSVTVVNAYTIVFRDGRHVEIPSEFTVTNSTLTYNVGNGIQVTIQLSTVDIRATESANGEAQGALWMKANAAQPPVVRAQQAGAARSITNGDLEKYRRARVESEKERRELGLPSLEERQAEVAAIQDRTVEQVRNMREREEAYWRMRTEELRAENDAQTGQWQQGSGEIPWAYSLGGFPAFSPFDGAGFGFRGGRFNRFGRVRPSPFDGFLATPITPFPSFPFSSHRRVFTRPAVRVVPRIVRGGSRR